MKNGKHGPAHNRPKFKIGKGEAFGGLTLKEISAWIVRVTALRTAKNYNLFCPENTRWRG